MAKALILMNGRFQIVVNCEWVSGTVYVAAHSKADAERLLKQASGRDNSFMNEINNYFSIGQWGNRMKDVTPERGVWFIQGVRSDAKPERLV